MSSVSLLTETHYLPTTVWQGRASLYNTDKGYIGTMSGLGRWVAWVWALVAVSALIGTDNSQRSQTCNYVFRVEKDIVITLHKHNFTQGHSGEQNFTQGHSGAQNFTQGHSGAQNFTQGHSGAQHFTQVHSGAQNFTQQHPGKHNRTQENPGQHNRTQENPGQHNRTQENPGQHYCVIQATADKHMRVVLDLVYWPPRPPGDPPSLDCSSDYVHVGNDMGRVDVDLVTSYKFCGEDVRHQLVSKGNQLWMVYRASQLPRDLFAKVWVQTAAFHGILSSLLQHHILQKDSEQPSPAPHTSERF
ncbi:hypothetical protein BsWGS_22187 [Bradybaena similaris]